jgi:tripartite-type tricarboxylate transporter receptor subunit TctC
MWPIAALSAAGASKSKNSPMDAAHSSDAIRDQLYEALGVALADERVRQRLAQIGAVPVGSTPAAFTRFCAEGRVQMANLVHEANIRLE